MTAPLNPAMQATAFPPVMQARRWLQGITFPPDRPLLNLSQAAPTAPPPLALRKAIARAALCDDSAHLYGPVLGLPALRAVIADNWSTLYGGGVSCAQVAVTQGCNQAFAAVIATLATRGDEVILPAPWYFNHKMWLDMQGITTVPLPAGPGLVPCADDAAALITPRTRAIVLVSPNNPGGAEYPSATLAAFAGLCRSRGLALIVDETYRDFDSRGTRPHDLFADPDWPESFIQLYSFSKAYRLTGHRVGAITASAGRLAQVEKFLDTVAICPNQLGQIAALWGLRNLTSWLAAERDEILSRRALMTRGFAGLPGWQLLGCGAYFAYVRHPHDMASDTLCRRLVAEASVLMLPGTMFRPETVPEGAHELRIAFANIDADGIAELFRRLAAYRP